MNEVFHKTVPLKSQHNTRGSENTCTRNMKVVISPQLIYQHYMLGFTFCVHLCKVTRTCIIMQPCRNDLRANSVDKHRMSCGLTTFTFL